MFTAIGLGSNLGNRLVNLRTALNFLFETNRDENKLIGTSDVFETEPWGVLNQPHFLNVCLIMQCLLPPEDLLVRVKEIEDEMGRTAARRWGERKIDIDILFVDSMAHDSPELHIPHADMHRRDFVLIPLAQIAPYWIHPCTKRTISDMASDFQNSNPVRICRL